MTAFISRLHHPLTLITLTILGVTYLVVTRSISWLPSSWSDPPRTQRKTMNIIYNTGNAAPETEFWMMEIIARSAALSSRPVKIILQRPGEEYVVEDSIAMTFWDTPKYIDLMQEYRQTHSGHPNMGLLRQGDEQMQDTSEMYSHVDYILRVYASFPGKHTYWNTSTGWDNKLNKVMWIPNGWAANVGPQDSQSLLPTSRRAMFCYFAGGSSRTDEWVSARGKMLDVLEDECIIKEERLEALEYKMDLGNTKYGLAPAGNVPESIRFYETLENGAIPIIVQDDWIKDAFGYLPLDLPDGQRWPFPVLSEWDELPSLLQRLKMEPDTMHDSRQRATVKWWTDLKMSLRIQANMLIDSSFESKYGKGY